MTGPFVWFFFNESATTEVCTLSLHDALPISERDAAPCRLVTPVPLMVPPDQVVAPAIVTVSEPVRVPPDCVSVVNRSAEHTSELQLRQFIVSRLMVVKQMRKLAVAPLKVRVP